MLNSRIILPVTIITIVIRQHTNCVMRSEAEEKNVFLYWKEIPYKSNKIGQSTPSQSPNCYEKDPSNEEKPQEVHRVKKKSGWKVEN